MTTTTEALKIAQYVATQFPDATAEQTAAITTALLTGELEICKVCNWTKDPGASCDYCDAVEAEANSYNDDYAKHATIYPEF